MFDQAEKVLEQAIEKYVEPGDLTVLEYDLIDVERARLFDAGTPDKAAIMELIAKFVAHTEKYQSSALGYSAAAELYLLMAEPAKAAEFSQKAVAIEPDYLAFRTLSIAQANLEKYGEAVDSAISASQFNPGFRGDIGLMMSAAYSFIGMGDIDNAKAALGALMQERPDVKQHEEFNQLLVFVYEKAEQLESQVE